MENKSIRIRTTPGVDKNINIKLEQSFDFLEILSLKISQEDVYRSYCANFGVVVGRVLSNNGFGVPNAKVSIFIPISSEDEQNQIIREIYPYKSTTTKRDNIRYNLLLSEATCNLNRPIGNFPTKQEILVSDSYIEVFEKYYKYTTKTNDSGDYMIFGVPLGNQIVHMDIDLSDIGFLSLRPYDLINEGYPEGLFETPGRFRLSTDLDSLAQIKTEDKAINIIPFWGDPDNCEIGITRVDFDINTNLTSSSLFFGHIFTDSARENGSGGLDINNSGVLDARCNPSRRMGDVSQLTTGNGEIEGIRVSEINIVEWKLNGKLEPLALENHSLLNGPELIDDNGNFVVAVPLNLARVITNEFGDLERSSDPEVGLPTKGMYRFKIKFTDNTENNTFRTANMIFPSIPEFLGGTRGGTSTGDPNFAGGTEDQRFTDKLYDYRNPELDFHTFEWKQVYTIAHYIKKYKIGRNNDKMGDDISGLNGSRETINDSNNYIIDNYLGIKDCDGSDTVNPFPFNTMLFESSQDYNNLITALGIQGQTSIDASKTKIELAKSLGLLKKSFFDAWVVGSSYLFKFEYKQSSIENQNGYVFCGPGSQTGVEDISGDANHGTYGNDFNLSQNTGMPQFGTDRYTMNGCCPRGHLTQSWTVDGNAMGDTISTQYDWYNPGSSQLELNWVDITDRHFIPWREMGEKPVGGCEKCLVRGPDATQAVNDIDIAYENRICSNNVTLLTPYFCSKAIVGNDQCCRVDDWIRNTYGYPLSGRRYRPMSGVTLGYYNSGNNNGGFNNISNQNAAYASYLRGSGVPGNPTQGIIPDYGDGTQGCIGAAGNGVINNYMFQETIVTDGLPNPNECLPLNDNGFYGYGPDAPNNTFRGVYPRFYLNTLDSDLDYLWYLPHYFNHSYHYLWHNEPYRDPIDGAPMWYHGAYDINDLIYCNAYNGTKIVNLGSIEMCEDILSSINDDIIGSQEGFLDYQQLKKVRTLAHPKDYPGPLYKVVDDVYTQTSNSVTTNFGSNPIDHPELINYDTTLSATTDLVYNNSFYTGTYYESGWDSNFWVDYLATEGTSYKPHGDEILARLMNVTNSSSLFQIFNAYTGNNQVSNPCHAAEPVNIKFNTNSKPIDIYGTLKEICKIYTQYEPNQFGFDANGNFTGVLYNQQLAQRFSPCGSGGEYNSFYLKNGLNGSGNHISGVVDVSSTEADNLTVNPADCSPGSVNPLNGQQLNSWSGIDTEEIGLLNARKNIPYYYFGVIKGSTSLDKLRKEYFVNS